MTEDSFLLMELLGEIRSVNKDDPNVNLFMGVLDNDLEAVKNALDAGANVNITDGAVIEYHRTFLLKRCPATLQKWETAKKMAFKTSH